MHYKIEWSTEIKNWDGNRIPIQGWTMVEAESFEDAVESADSLCDVDFFVPEEKYSASSREVIMGRMWRVSQPERELSSLTELLPMVDEWNFDNIEITGIEKVEP